MTFPPLADAGIMLGVHATDWRDAVRIAGRALRLSGSTRAEYSDRMISVIEEFGAYVVVAPGLALAHARPRARRAPRRARGDGASGNATPAACTSIRTSPSPVGSSISTTSAACGPSSRAI